MENIDYAQENGPQVKADTFKGFWTRDSYILLGGFFLVIMLVVYFWWPLAASMLRRIHWDGQWWLQMDWLLIGIFAFTSLAIIARANLKTDALIIFVGLCGGLVIEAWGTQTNLWTYYSHQTPPLFAVLAHGMASVAFWRAGMVLKMISKKIADYRINLYN